MDKKNITDIINDKNLNINIENEVKTLCNINNCKKNILVLAGGGIKGIYIIGCLKYLEEKGFLKNIDTYAGTSIGGILSFMLNIGFTIDEMYKFSKIFDLEKSTDFNIANISNIFNTYSICNNDNLEKILINQMKLKNINPDIKLIELYKKTKKKLILTTVCINTKQVEYLSYETYPEMPLITALKMTSAVPLLFPFVEYNDKKYVDGGLLENFPISIFDDQLDKVIGINIMSELPVKHSNIIEYILLVLGIVYYNGFDKYNIEKYKKSVFNLVLNDNNTFNFELTPEKKKEMYYEGYNLIKKNFNIE